MRRAAWLAPLALAVGCTAGSDGVRESLANVDTSGGYWAIRATCEGGRFEVDFRPGERLSVPGLGFASSEEIGVECGDPERATVTDEELRSQTPSGADLAAPTSASTKLSCSSAGPLVVSVNPVRTEYLVAGGALRVEQGGHAIVAGAMLNEDYGTGRLQWWRRHCRPA